MYPKKLDHYINGQWVQPTSGKTHTVLNPANNSVIAELGCASRADLDTALEAADKGFSSWSRTSPYERSKVLRRAADLLRSRAEPIAVQMTLEQGKVLAEARNELASASDVLEWNAEEGRRAYGRLVPARAEGVRNMVVMEPLGPVAAFSPWNFPVNQAVRKIGPALAAGCSIIIKCPEETPASPIGLVQCLHDAGLPPGVLNLVYGVPSEISGHLIPSPVIRKLSFTGSVPVGKHLAALAGQHMKRVTMELGGHSPVLVYDDVDLDAVVKLLVGAKFRNAGQVCIAPTRFYVHKKVYDRFVAEFARTAAALKVGNGTDPTSQMGPLANPRRVTAMEELLADAQERGAEVVTGGNRIGREGNFFEPTVVAGVSREARLMRDEPFGPVAIIVPFDDDDSVLAEANALPFGLASYVFTTNTRRADRAARGLMHGMVSINHFGLLACEAPFGGVKDSGMGHEGGIEGLQAFMFAKTVSQLS